LGGLKIDKRNGTRSVFLEMDGAGVEAQVASTPGVEVGGPSVGTLDEAVYTDHAGIRRTDPPHHLSFQTLLLLWYEDQHEWRQS